MYTSSMILDNIELIEQTCRCVARSCHLPGDKMIINCVSIKVHEFNFDLPIIVVKTNFLEK